MTRHEVFENLSVAFDTLRARKVRSGLTILGIVIGVTTVIAVASIIDGLNGEIKERVERLGSNTLFVTRFPAAQDPNRMSAKIRMRKYLQDDDADFIEETAPAVAYSTVFANRINFNDQVDEIRYGNEHVERFFLRGVQPHYIDAFPLFAVAEGRFISSYDDEHARDVVDIGRSIADSLFPNVDPLGKSVRLDGRL
jgi:putative ABC transport system permease protein